VRALSAGIDLARTSDGEESDSDTNNTVHNSSSNGSSSKFASNGNSDRGSDSDSSSSDEGYVAADDSELDAEEERYMEGLDEVQVRTFTE
jgi:hypothetical protein